MRSSLRRRVTYVLALATLGGAATVVACGFKGVGTNPSSTEGGNAPVYVEADVDDATAFLLDSSFETPISDQVDSGFDGACPPDSFRCASSGACVTSCLGCGSDHLACAASSTCVDRCASCTNAPFECWACASTSAITLAKATCEATPATCNVDAVYCDCKALGGCFGPFQVCLKTGKGMTPVQCRGCGDMATDRQTCVGAAGATTCSALTATCQ